MSTKSTWRWADLFVDHRTGMLRESKLWSNIGKAAMTFGFLFIVIVEHGQYNPGLWAAYGAVIMGHETATRWMNQRDRQIDGKEKENVDKPTS